MEVSIDDLQLAVEFVSSCPSLESEAFLDRKTGTIYYSGDCVDEDLPIDVYENERYLSVPSKQDLDLGRSLALAFTAQQLPSDLDSVYEFFRRKGAYSKFKLFLERTGSLEQWYAFEIESVNTAIEHWCKEHNLMTRST
ncbi:hypothetical protein [Endozoicomonas sp.]|uniref:hypothetical protein n=1 Tax=Endozoicomonas sp. TaxID=1892382 RepID=UPI00288542FF|nr:hypothetical protein [Endozoicomonas sp.]